MSQATQLKRSLNALKRLRNDMKYMVSLETYHGMGNVLLRTYNSLHQSIMKLIDEPIVQALVVDLPEDATDRQKAMQVNLLAGQLLSHLEDIYEEMLADNEPDTESLSEEERVRRRFNDMMDDN